MKLTVMVRVAAVNPTRDSAVKLCSLVSTTQDTVMRKMMHWLCLATDVTRKLTL